MQSYEGEFDSKYIKVNTHIDPEFKHKDTISLYDLIHSKDDYIRKFSLGDVDIYLDVSDSNILMGIEILG